ncbi:MAG TPA: hypothetical protein PL137_18790, partial [Nocardioides sp.]|nr:hypothetical protein [Nocardioides sp.]
MLAGENISARFVVPTVAASVDLVVHLGIDEHGVRRVNEIVGVPGRVENDVIEIEPVFVRRDGELRRTGGLPPRLDRFERRGIDVHRLGGLMGALVGLGFGIGLVLVWSAFFVPVRPRRRARRDGRAAELLARAGLGEVSPSGFVLLCVGCGAAGALVVELLSRTPPVAVAFGVIAGYLPVAVVSGRGRRRQREFAEVWPGMTYLGLAIQHVRDWATKV